MLAVLAHEPCAAGALPGDVVAVSSILALAHHGTVFTKETQRASLCTVESSPPRGAFALSVVGAAVGSVVTVACMDAVWSPVGRWARL